MEEILQSIRRIIAEESDEPVPEADPVPASLPPAAAPATPAAEVPASIPAAEPKPEIKPEPQLAASPEPEPVMVPPPPVSDAPPPLSQAGIAPPPPEPEIKPEPKAISSDVLELTEAIQDDGSVINLKKQNEKIEQDEPTQEAAEVLPAVNSNSDLDILQSIDHALLAEPEPFLSEQAADATRQALEKLAAAQAPVMEEPVAHATAKAVMQDGSLETLVMKALRPMLREWLDTHLPAIVEKVVEREIKGLSATPPKK